MAEATNEVLPRWRCEVRKSHDIRLIAVFPRAKTAQDAVDIVKTMYGAQVEVSPSPDGQ